MRAALRKLLLAAALWGTALTAALLSGAVLPQIAVPPPAGRVTDQTATLTQEQVAALDQMLKAFEAKKGSQAAVLMVPTTGGEPIEQFALRVAEQWKIGRKSVSDGVLLVVAKNDRALRIEVGYGLEGALSDAVSKRIISEIIVPRFKEGDFYGGIQAGTARMLRVIDGEPLPPPVRRGVEEDIAQFFPALIVISLILGTLLRALLGRVPGALLSGATVGLLAWLLAGALLMSVVAGVIVFGFTLFGGGMHRGGRLGGLGHGGFGSGGGLGGGFGGGGGGFGGGGASGRW